MARFSHIERPGFLVGRSVYVTDWACGACRDRWTVRVGDPEHVRCPSCGADRDDGGGPAAGVVIFLWAMIRAAAHRAEERRLVAKWLSGRMDGPLVLGQVGWAKVTREDAPACQVTTVRVRTMTHEVARCLSSHQLAAFRGDPVDLLTEVVTDLLDLARGAS